MTQGPGRLTRRSLLWMATGGATAAHAGEPLLHVLVDGSLEMPQVGFKDGHPVDGLQYFIAQEIAQRLGRTARFRLVPRRRMAQLLGEGQEADLVCDYLPGWLPGPLQWSRPYLDDADLLVTATRRPAPAQLQEVMGQRIGTVSGFLYPETETALGTGFVRDDAPNLIANLRKLASGRIDHAIVGRVTFDYLQRRGEVPLELHPPLVIARLRTACALSPRSPIPLPLLDAALAAMQADGSLARIVERFR
jgi:ABC-type amino acid transport substrate-binding protein